MPGAKPFQQAVASAPPSWGRTAGKRGPQRPEARAMHKRRPPPPSGLRRSGGSSWGRANDQGVPAARPPGRANLAGPTWPGFQRERDAGVATSNRSRRWQHPVLGTARCQKGAAKAAKVASDRPAGSACGSSGRLSHSPSRSGFSTTIAHRSYLRLGHALDQRDDEGLQVRHLRSARLAGLRQRMLSSVRCRAHGVTNIAVACVT